MTLLLLFSSAFLAATLLPAQSEAVLAGLYLTGNYSTITLVMVATFGNVLGACVNWLLGRYALNFKHKRWFPVKEAALQKAERIYKRYGMWTLLLAWLPVIGDPLTFIAGVLRTAIVPFLILVTIGKAGRYVAVIYFIS